MNDYISREDVRRMILEYSADNPKKQTVWAMVISDMLRDLKEIPATDVQTIRRGRWITITNERGSDTICSRCYKTMVVMRTDFCPTCGADMRGEGNG